MHLSLTQSSFSLTDDEGALKDASVVRMFLMMHPWYISSTDFAKKLFLKYPLLHCMDKNNTLPLATHCGKMYIYITVYLNSQMMIHLKSILH